MKTSNYNLDSCSNNPLLLAVTYINNGLHIVLCQTLKKCSQRSQIMQLGVIAVFVLTTVALLLMSSVLVKVYAQTPTNRKWNGELTRSSAKAIAPRDTIVLTITAWSPLHYNRIPLRPIFYSNVFTYFEVYWLSAGPSKLVKVCHADISKVFVQLWNSKL